MEQGIKINLDSWDEVWALLEKHDEPEYTYFIGAADGTEVKIGRSKQPGVRLGQLQTGRPEPLYLYGYIPHKTPNTEKELHEKFAEYRLHGEWFIYSPDIRSYIHDMKVQLGVR